MKTDWTSVSRNPVSKEVFDFILLEMKKRKAENVGDFMMFIKSFVEGHDVLDIGIVEHDISHIGSDRWKHKSIRSWAKSILGVDILEAEVNLLKERGFNVSQVDATSDIDLGSRFDRIVVGDVLEHVENPVNLLRFAGRHLSDDGQILLSTPNPYYYPFIVRTIKEGTLIANAEHMSWISPSMALELGRRSNLNLRSYHLAHGIPKSWLKRILKNILSLIIGKDSELFAGAYIYIFEKQK